MSNTGMEKLYKCFLQCKGLSTDTRSIQKDMFFVALKGANFDGNLYANQALEKGAKYVLIDNPEVKKDERYLVTDNCLQSLQALARHHRLQQNIPFLALTGSNGKTTTKELVKSVLAQQYKVYATPGNFNNHIGLPLTLLNMPPDTEIAIIEMGANHPGEIKFLCDIARPDSGLITCIGKAHLEGFGSLEGVQKAKGELFDFLSEHNGTVFINTDDPLIIELTAGNRFGDKQSLTYGTNRQQTTISGTELTNENNTFLAIKWFWPLEQSHTENPVYIPLQTQLTGNYNLINVLAAISTGHYFKIPAHKIKQGIEAYRPKNNRSQIVKGKNNNVFVMDAYNANPSSMKAALLNFKCLKTKGKKIAVLGDMLELGEYSLGEHYFIISLVDKFRFDRIILVGKHFGTAWENFDKTNIKPNSIIHFSDNAALKQWINKQDFKGCNFLIKGSRGIALEKGMEGLL